MLTDIEMHVNDLSGVAMWQEIAGTKSVTSWLETAIKPNLNKTETRILKEIKSNYNQ